MSHKISPRFMASVLIASLLFSPVLSASAQSVPDEEPAPNASIYLPLVTNESQSAQQVREGVQVPEESLGEPTAETPLEEAEIVYAAAYQAPGNWTVGGRVGIGTETPAGPLHLNHEFGAPPNGLPAAQNGLLLGVQSRAGYKWIQSYGGSLALNPKGNNVGIGTTTPFYKLDVYGDVGVTFGKIFVEDDLYTVTTISADRTIVENLFTGQSTTIRAGSIVVNGTTMNVPDYVFEAEYPLMPLAELRAYVGKEKHLPNVPSAKTIQQGGLDMTGFQLKLLEKIEELTLYTLAQDEQLKSQQAQLELLQGQNADFEARLAALEQQ